MAVNTAPSLLSQESITSIFEELKSIYNVDKVAPERKEYIVSQVQKYGYLPYPHIKALEELTVQETIVGLIEKFKLNGIYKNDRFDFEVGKTSAVARGGFSNSAWIKTEQHNIKLVNLAGLGNGNVSEDPGKFIDWLKQILILPSGNLEKGILSTTAYLIPFHPRDFGCAYLPKSSDVSPNLEDKILKDKLGLDVKEQVQLFIAFAQLAGHPVIYDVLPQTGRFSKVVLANPHIARWFDINEMISKLRADLELIAQDIQYNTNYNDIFEIKEVVSRSLSGDWEDIPDYHKDIVNRFEEILDSKRKMYSNDMLSKENQERIHARVKGIINSLAGKGENDDLTEEDITNQDYIIGELIKQGLWPAPGGAWCSSGVPVFNKMNKGGGFPLFKHYDYKGKDVTHFANLDCQTPFYFVYLESGEYNEKVISFFIDYLSKMRSEYNFDGFRVDHIDHVVDDVSETDEGRPISYRAPRVVLGRLNSELKAQVPYFGTLAEYMLWERFFIEYHKDMNFDLLWGSDIVSQYLKNVDEIILDNEELATYNSRLGKGDARLSILKTYNNQDGEFRAIDQYPAQLGETGALFKLFKFKFLPGGSHAQRPVLYIDGDESFTKTGIERVIGAEVSMKREKNYEFFRKFDALNRLALNLNLTRYGKAQIHQPNKDGSGFISWYIKNDDAQDSERLFIAANENPPTEIYRDNKEDGSLEIINKTSTAIHDKTAYIPDGYKAVSAYVLKENSFEYEEITEIQNLNGNQIHFEKLEPAEFHIYKIVRG